MTHLKCVAGAALLLLSGAACADGFKGSAGAVSEYLFRGIEGSEGAAVQGEVYYSWDQGFYAGAWMTNAKKASSKADIYAGYETKIGEFSVGGGAVYRLYTEDKEHGTLTPQGRQIDYGELFVTGGVGPAALTVYYTDDYFGTGKDGTYVTGDVTLHYNETVSFILQAGFNGGAGVELMRGEQYTDYSATLEKKLENDFSAMFQIADTDRSFTVGTNKVKDDPKFVVGFKKEFTF